MTEYIKDKLDLIDRQNNVKKFSIVYHCSGYTQGMAPIFFHDHVITPYGDNLKITRRHSFFTPQGKTMPVPITVDNILEHFDRFRRSKMLSQEAESVKEIVRKGGLSDNLAQVAALATDRESIIRLRGGEKAAGYPIISKFRKDVYRHFGYLFYAIKSEIDLHDSDEAEAETVNILTMLIADPFKLVQNKHTVSKYLLEENLIDFDRLLSVLSKHSSIDVGFRIYAQSCYGRLEEVVKGREIGSFKEPLKMPLISDYLKTGLLPQRERRV